MTGHSLTLSRGTDEMAPAREVYNALSGTTINAAVLVKMRAPFAGFLKLNGITPDKKIYEDFIYVSMALQTMEHERQSCLDDITLLLNQLSLLLERRDTRTVTKNPNHQIVKSLPEDSTVRYAGNGIMRMRTALTADPISATQVINVSTLFRKNLERLGRDEENVGRRFSFLQLQETFERILYFFRVFLSNGEELHAKIVSVRQELSTLFGFENMAEIPCQTAVAHQNTDLVMKKPKKKIEPKKTLTKPMIVKEPVQVITEVETPEDQGAVGAAEEATSPETVEQNRTAKEVEKLNDLPAESSHRNTGKFGDATSVRQLLEMSGVGIRALSLASKVPPEILLRMKNGTQACHQNLFAQLLQHAEVLPRLSPQERDYVGEAQSTELKIQNGKFECMPSVTRNSEEEPKNNLNPDEEIFDEGHIQTLLASYDVRLDQLFPCPQEADQARHAAKLVNLRAIIDGTRRCKRGRLTELRKTIEDACLEILKNKHAETDVTSDIRGREKDVAAQRLVTDEGGLLKRLLSLKKKSVSVLFFSMKDAVQPLIGRVGNNTSPEQQRAMQELSSMELGTLMRIVDGTGECSLNALNMLEDITRKLPSNQENPAP